jgi:DNA invertase Pin-like site-specific DNA recombinase
MNTVGYVRVSTDKQADRGISLEAQAEKIRAMATLQDRQLVEILVDGGESAKSLKRPGMAKLLAMIDAGQVQTVIIAKLDRLTRSVRDLCELLERFERRGVALVSVAESLDTGSAAGRLVLNIMAAVSQWEREAIGERTRDALRHKRTNGERTGNIPYGRGRCARRRRSFGASDPDGDPPNAPRRHYLAGHRHQAERLEMPHAPGDILAS